MLVAIFKRFFLSYQGRKACQDRCQELSSRRCFLDWKRSSFSRFVPLKKLAKLNLSSRKSSDPHRNHPKVNRTPRFYHKLSVFFNSRNPQDKNPKRKNIASNFSGYILPSKQKKNEIRKVVLPVLPVLWFYVCVFLCSQAHQAENIQFESSQERLVSELQQVKLGFVMVQTHPGNGRYRTVTYISHLGSKGKIIDDDVGAGWLGEDVIVPRRGRLKVR